MLTALLCASFLLIGVALERNYGDYQELRKRVSIGVRFDISAPGSWHFSFDDNDIFRLNRID